MKSWDKQEIRQAVKKLKNKKSPFFDKIRRKKKKKRNDQIEPWITSAYLHQTFNLILQCGKILDIWCQGLISPIYKSGDKSDPTSYIGNVYLVASSM